MRTKGQIVREWRERAKLSPAALGRLVDTSRQNIENLEADAVDQPRYLPRLARVMGYATVEELLELKEPPPTVTEFILPAPRSAEAQPLSEELLRIPARPLRWGELKMMIGSGEVPEFFEVTLEDDAMGPEFRAGTVVRFKRGMDAKFGNRVLLLDRTGELHFREFAQNLDGEPWEGSATGRGFRTILPRQHGATVVAVKIGHYVEGS